MEYNMDYWFTWKIKDFHVEGSQKPSLFNWKSLETEGSLGICARFVEMEWTTLFMCWTLVKQLEKYGDLLNLQKNWKEGWTKYIKFVALLQELWSFVINKFVAENIKFVNKINLRLKNYGRKLVILGPSRKSICDHFIS